MPPKTSNTEAMRKCRAKRKGNPEAHQAYLQREKERYKKRKEEGKIVNISSLPGHDQLSLRGKWKKEKRYQRRRQNEAENVSNQNTTPEGPPEAVDSTNDLEDPEPSTSQTPTSYQKNTGRKKIKKEYSSPSMPNQQIVLENLPHHLGFS